LLTYPEFLSFQTQTGRKKLPSDGDEVARSGVGCSSKGTVILKRLGFTTTPQLCPDKEMASAVH